MLGFGYLDASAHEMTLESGLEGQNMLQPLEEDRVPCSTEYDKKAGPHLFGVLSVTNSSTAYAPYQIQSSTMYL